MFKRGDRVEVQHVETKTISRVTALAIQSVRLPQHLLSHHHPEEEKTITTVGQMEEIVDRRREKMDQPQIAVEVNNRATRRHLPKNILHHHRHNNSTHRRRRVHLRLTMAREVEVQEVVDRRFYSY